MLLPANSGHDKRLPYYQSNPRAVACRCSQDTTVIDKMDDSQWNNELANKAITEAVTLLTFRWV
jgi:hypothetical protein